MWTGWGLDITGSQTGAAGVGALLQIADHPSGKTFLPCYDGRGNVVALINGSTGALAAAYEYSPFGEFLRCESPDPVVADQPFRFSTKQYDGETGLVYHDFRYYSPSKGRFLGRDPIEEKGGLNLYGYTRNNPINRWDYMGLSDAIKMAAFVVTASRIPSGTTYSTGMTFGDTGSDYGYGPSASDNGGGGGGFDPFTYTGPMLFDRAVVTNDAGRKFIVVGSAGTDANGNPLWNAVPLRDYLIAEARARTAAAAADAAASMAALNVSAGQMALNFAAGAGTAVVIGAVIVATGGTAAPIIGLAIAGMGAVHTVGTYADMYQNPGNYTPGQVANLTAGAAGAIAGGAALGAVLSGPTAPGQNVTLVIGRGADLARPGALAPGEAALRWTPTGSTRTEWQTNSSLLRTWMNELRPIRDASPGNTGGRYLNAERNLLTNHGWTFDPATNLWMPPTG